MGFFLGVRLDDWTTLEARASKRNFLFRIIMKLPYLFYFTLGLRKFAR